MKRGTSLLPGFLAGSYLRKFAAVVVVIALLVTSIGVYVQVQTEAELGDSVRSNMQTVTELRAYQLQEWNEEQTDNARLISDLAALRSGNHTKIEAQFDAQMETASSTVAGYHYIDRTSYEILASTDHEMEGRSVGEMGIVWQNGSLAGLGPDDVLVSEAYRVDGASRMAFVSPIEDSFGMLLLTVDLAQVSAWMGSTEDTTVRVVDSRGVVEVAPGGDEILSASQYDLDVAATGRSGVFEDGDDVVAYAQVEGTDWIVTSHTPRSAAYSLLDTIRTSLIALVGVALLGFVLVGATIGRDTVRSLNSLTDRAEAIASGTFTFGAEAESARRDEIGDLRRSFADMEGYLTTVSEQSSALANQRFDADVLEEDVPGEFGETLDTMQTELTRLVEDIRTSQAEAERLTAELEANAEEFSAVMRRAAAGDLTQRLPTDSSNDAMREIGIAFNGMIEDIEATTAEVRRFAAYLSTVSAEVRTGTEEVQNAGEEVGVSVQRISEDVAAQTDHLGEVTGEMNDLSATIEEIASSANEVASMSSAATEAGIDGSELADEAVSEMQSIEARTEQTVDAVTALAAQIEEIDGIVAVITKIAEQTNLLALNANIEAARAGEAGEGFAVVANEVKKLATETQESTTEIARLIESIQAESTDAVEDIRRMRAGVEGGIDTIERSLSTFESVIDHVQQTNDGMQSINAATDEQATSAEGVVTMSEEAAALSESVADETESVSAAAEEQVAALSQVADETQTLDRQADDLMDAVRKFTIDADGSAPVADADERAPIGDADGSAPASDITPGAAGGRRIVPGDD